MPDIQRTDQVSTFSVGYVEPTTTHIGLYVENQRLQQWLSIPPSTHIVMFLAMSSLMTILIVSI